MEEEIKNNEQMIIYFFIVKTPWQSNNETQFILVFRDLPVN